MIIRFDTDNAAFEDRGTEEYAWILKHIIGDLREGLTRHPIWDSNGNRIGEWSDEDDC